MEHDLGRVELHAEALEGEAGGGGDEVAHGGLFRVEDGLACVGGGELSPRGLAFLRAAVAVRGGGVEVVEGVGLEDRGVNEGAEAQRLRLFLGRVDVGLIVRRRGQHVLRGGLVERREGAVFFAVVDLWHVVRVWWEMSEDCVVLFEVV